MILSVKGASTVRSAAMPSRRIAVSSNTPLTGSRTPVHPTCFTAGRSAGRCPSRIASVLARPNGGEPGSRRSSRSAPRRGGRQVMGITSSEDCPAFYSHVPRLPPPAAASDFTRSAARRGLPSGAFTETPTRALFGGAAAHWILPLENPATASLGTGVPRITALRHGWPRGEGGSQGLANALLDYFRCRRRRPHRPTRGVSRRALRCWNRSV